MSHLLSDLFTGNSSLHLGYDAGSQTLGNRNTPLQYDIDIIEVEQR